MVWKNGFDMSAKGLRIGKLAWMKTAARAAVTPPVAATSAGTSAASNHGASTAATAASASPAQASSSALLGDAGTPASDLAVDKFAAVGWEPDLLELCWL